MTQHDESDEESKTRRPRRFIIPVLLVVSAAIMLNVFSGIENWKRDLTTNHAELDPQSDDPLLRPQTVIGSSESVAGQIEKWAATQSRWSLAARDESDATITLQLEHKTRWLRFTDDIRVTLSPEGHDKTLIEAESQSRVGKADLGQNPRNLRELVRGVLDEGTVLK